MAMKVYVNGRLTIVESNVAYAVPYWTERKRIRERDGGVKITWRIE